MDDVRPRLLLAFLHEAQEDRRGANARLRVKLADLASVRLRQSQQQHNLVSYALGSASDGGSAVAALELELRTVQDQRFRLVRTTTVGELAKSLSPLQCRGAGKKMSWRRGGQSC